MPEKFLSVHLDDGAGSRDKSVGGGTATQAKTIRSCEFDRHAPVLSALFLDLGDRQLPDLGCARDMGAAARLQIDLPCAVTDPHKPNTPCPAWRLH